MGIFYFTIGTIILLVRKTLGYSDLEDSNEEITELGMYYTFRTIVIVMCFIILYKILQRLDIF